jgi:Macrocin-O-methyltransferase (TylF)
VNNNANTKKDPKFIVSKDTPSSCPQMDFPPRNSNDETAFNDAWNGTVHYVRQNELTFLKEPVLSFHRDKLHEIESAGLSGMIIECGVAKAGSSITFAAYKHPRRCLHLFDTFEGIPTPSERDGKDVVERYHVIQNGKEACKKGLPECDKKYYGNMDNLLEYDIGQFESSGFPAQDNSVYFHKGLFDETVWPAGPIAYAHLVRYTFVCKVGCFQWTIMTN